MVEGAARPRRPLRTCFEGEGVWGRGWRRVKGGAVYRRLGGSIFDVFASYVADLFGALFRTLFLMMLDGPGRFLGANLGLSWDHFLTLLGVLVGFP